MGVTTDLHDLLEAPRRIGAPIDRYSGEARGRPVQDVRFIFSLDDVRGRVQVLWVLPEPVAVASPRLDTMVLSLYRQGAAGLVIPRTPIPESTRVLSDRIGFPIIGVALEHLDEVVREWRRFLDARELADLKRMEGLKTALLDAWMASGSVEAYLIEAGRIVGGRVWFSDLGSDHPSRPSPDSDELEIPWGRGKGGRLVIALPPETDGAFRAGIVPYLVSLVAMLIDREASEIESAIRLRGELLLELLVDRDAPTGSVIRAAQRFGMDLGRKHLVVLWDLDDFTAVAQRSGMTEARILRSKQALTDTLEAAARKVFREAWVLPHSDEFVLVAESRGGDQDTPSIKKTVIELQLALRGVLDQYGIRGISAGLGFSYSGARGLQKSFEEAHEALLVGLSQFGPGSVTHFKDLGIHRFLYGWVDTPRSRTLASDFLKPVLDEDSLGRGEFLKTLRTYLEAKGRASVAAQELSIHRNTLRYRLKRIEELLNVDLDDANAQLVLQLLVRALPGPANMHKN